MSDEKITKERAFILMFENSVKVRKLTDGELLVEICEAFFDQEIHTWKDALLNELMERFEAAVRRKRVMNGLTRNAKFAECGGDLSLEQTLECRLELTQYLRALFASAVSK